MAYSKNKIELDLERAIVLREQAALYLNFYFMSNAHPFRITRLHKYVQILKPEERSRFNTVHNRTTDSDSTKNMGLDYILYNSEKPEKQIMVIFRFTSDSSCYLKLPSGMTENAVEYVNYLINTHNAHFLYLTKVHGSVSKMYSNLIPLENIGKGFKSDSTGNKNRIDFPSVTPSQQITKPIDKFNLFGDSLIEQITNLLT